MQDNPGSTYSDRHRPRRGISERIKTLLCIGVGSAAGLSLAAQHLEGGKPPSDTQSIQHVDAHVFAEGVRRENNKRLAYGALMGGVVGAALGMMRRSKDEDEPDESRGR